MSTTTIRVKIETKEKIAKLKKGLSYDKYIDNLNKYVESNAFDIKNPTVDLEKLIKDRVGAIMKILRAFEKTYFSKNKQFLELLLQNTLSNEMPVLDKKESKKDEIRTKESENIILNLKKEIEFLKRSLENNSDNSVSEIKKEEIINVINQIKSNNKISRNEVVFNSFFFNQKIDFLKGKITNL